MNRNLKSRKDSSRNIRPHSDYQQLPLLRLIQMISVIAIPVALQNLLTTTGSMVDTIMLASLGERTIGAAGLCAQYSSLMFSGYWGFVGGGMLFFSQFYGSGEHENIRKSYGMTIVFMMISGVTFGALAVFAPMSVMRLYTGSEAIQKIGVRYLQIVGFAYPLQVLAMAQSALLRSIGQVKIPLFGAIASVITNFVINFILIFGKFGFPKMGIRGAAVGTVAAAAVNILVIVVAARIMHLPYLMDVTRHFRWNRKLLSAYLRKSAPIIANEVMIGIGNMLINIVLGHQIESAIAATAVFRTLEGIIIASVVPSVMYPVTNACRRYFHVRPLVVGPGVKTGVKVRANNPRETGADLIVNCAAAVELYGGPAIIVDYGTATSFTLMLEDGTLDSVIIAPGIQTSLTSLSTQASMITDVEIRKPKHVLPHETSECIQAGIVYSTVGSTQYIVRKMKEASGLHNVKVIATGGFGKMFADEIDEIDFFDALLPQHGLRIIYEKNCG